MIKKFLSFLWELFADALDNSNAMVTRRKLDALSVQLAFAERDEWDEILEKIKLQELILKNLEVRIDARAAKHNTQKVSASH